MSSKEKYSAGCYVFVGKDCKKENSPPSTQEDMFKDDDSDEEMHHTATPSRYLPNLQLSAEPMLVPETIEESM